MLAESTPLLFISYTLLVRITPYGLQSYKKTATLHSFSVKKCSFG